jgi:hypothetical protein
MKGWISRKQFVRMGSGCSWLRIVSVATFGIGGVELSVLLPDVATVLQSCSTVFGPE